VLKNDLFPVTTSNDAQINDIVQCLKSQINTAHRILGRSSFEQYDYYKLKNPVPILDDDRPTADIVRDCLDKSNWQAVSPHRPVKELAPTLSGYYVYMVIQPKGELPAYLLIIG
jgi:hypothetical protein